jgi:hypothetical protein
MPPPPPMGEPLFTKTLSETDTRGRIVLPKAAFVEAFPDQAAATLCHSDVTLSVLAVLQPGGGGSPATSARYILRLLFDHSARSYCLLGARPMLLAMGAAPARRLAFGRTPDGALLVADASYGTPASADEDDEKVRGGAAAAAQRTAAATPPIVPQPDAAAVAGGPLTGRAEVERASGPRPFAAYVAAAAAEKPAVARLIERHIAALPAPATHDAAGVAAAVSALSHAGALCGDWLRELWLFALQREYEAAVAAGAPCWAPPGAAADVATAAAAQAATRAQRTKLEAMLDVWCAWCESQFQ